MSQPLRLSIERARRLALGAQGLRGPRPSGRVDVRHLRRVLRSLGAVQLDSVNVLVRSHYLPFFARLGPYPTERLDRYLYRSGEGFEYLGHEASVMPVHLQPPFRHRMRRIRPWRRVVALQEEHPGYVESVLAEVERSGPLSIRELSDPGKRTGPWWGSPRGKTALEWLYATGRLAVHERRPDFTTVYDLPERVLPAEVIASPDPDPDQAVDALLLRAAAAMGVATASDLADYFRLRGPRVRRRLAGLVRRGALREAEVEGWGEPAFLDPEAAIPRRAERRALLSPFDSLIWHRPRTERLFGFRYRIEIYVPKDRRQFGYYVLPFLLGDRLVARVDLKADRAAGRLLVRNAHLEPGEPVDRVAAALAAQLREMACWLALADVTLERGNDLHGLLSRHLG